MLCGANLATLADNLDHVMLFQVDVVDGEVSQLGGTQPSPSACTASRERGGRRSPVSRSGFGLSRIGQVGPVGIGTSGGAP